MGSADVVRPAPPAPVANCRWATLSPVPDDRSELSSLATQVEELTARVAAAGERLDQEPTADAAASLFEVERALRTAGRALDRAARQLG